MAFLKNWSTNGDMNTKFLYIYAKIKNILKLITSLKIKNDVITDRGVSESHITDHFKNLFNQSSILHDSVTI